MKYLDLTFDEPAANLACDDALLEAMDSDESVEECLRIWHSKKYFVVLGHSSRLSRDVNIAACEQDRVPVLRRLSGGGTVLQGPGCLNYSLILRHDARRLRNIGDTFEAVLQRHRWSLEGLCGAQRVRVEGISDLAIAGRKFSGNAQYRKANCVLVHGTFLLDFDLSQIERYLKLPARQPAYRKGRPHLEFLMNLNMDAARLCQRLREAWGAAQAALPNLPPGRIEELVRERHQKREWLRKF